MKKSIKNGLGKYIYTEWLLPVKDYYCSIRKNEVVFEIIIPIFIALGCTIKYSNIGKLFHALKRMSELLPTAISILIGFTFMLITLLLTSSGPNVELLKEKETGTILYGKPVTLYQGLHIQFSHSLFSEIILLLLIFFYLFWSGLGMPNTIALIILAVEVYLTLNILFSILRGITSLYFSFYNKDRKQ